MPSTPHISPMQNSAQGNAPRTVLSTLTLTERHILAANPHHIPAQTILLLVEKYDPLFVATCLRASHPPGAFPIDELVVQRINYALQQRAQCDGRDYADVDREFTAQCTMKYRLRRAQREHQARRMHAMQQTTPQMQAGPPQGSSTIHGAGLQRTQQQTVPQQQRYSAAPPPLPLEHAPMFAPAAPMQSLFPPNARSITAQQAPIAAPTQTSAFRQTSPPIARGNRTAASGTRFNPVIIRDSETGTAPAPLHRPPLMHAAPTAAAPRPSPSALVPTPRGNTTQSASMLSISALLNPSM